jgi:hypothetical protein
MKPTISRLQQDNEKDRERLQKSQTRTGYWMLEGKK